MIIYLIYRWYGSQAQLDFVVWKSELLIPLVKSIYAKYPDGWFSVKVEAWRQLENGTFNKIAERKIGTYDKLIKEQWPVV